MVIATCRACTRKIHWAKNENDKWVPLDADMQVYEIDPDDPLKCRRTTQAFVTHFQTCPYANRFSGSR